MRPDKVFKKEEIASINAALELVLGEYPILPQREFSILIGESVEQAQALLRRWPDVDVNSDPEWFLIFGILGRLRGYPHKQEKRLFEETGLRKENLKRLLDKLRPLKPILP